MKIWIGLSEITHLGGGRSAVIERDKGWGPTTGLTAEQRSIYGIRLADAEFRPYNAPAGLVTVEKSQVRNLLPILEANSIWASEKIEGLVV